jgi:HK97 family phage portal protein
MKSKLINGIKDFVALINRATMGTGGTWGVGGGYWGRDEWGTFKIPTSFHLVNEYKGITYACSNINARAMAASKFKLYVKTTKTQPKPRVATAPVSNLKVKAMATLGGYDVQEVLEHPFLTLLNHPCDDMDGFTLLELTTLYQEMEGNAYWWLPMGPLGTRSQILILPSHLVMPRRRADGKIECFFLGAQRIEPEEIIWFRYPNLKDPYGMGWSPCRALWEGVELLGNFRSHAHATIENRARPDVIISPKEAIGEDEAERLTAIWRKRFRRRGSGGPLVAETGLDVHQLQISPKDLEMLALYKVTKTELCNGYDVPESMLEGMHVNRATAEAGHYQHAKMGLMPRSERFAGRINHHLLPQFDERLFIAYDNLVPDDATQDAAIANQELSSGIRTINEVRKEHGLDPVAWGEKPWLASSLAQPSDDPASNEKTTLPGPENVDDPIVDPKAPKKKVKVPA